jgi:hypothetical protein
MKKLKPDNGGGQSIAVLFAHEKKWEPNWGAASEGMEKITRRIITIKKTKPALSLQTACRIARRLLEHLDRAMRRTPVESAA